MVKLFEKIDEFENEIGILSEHMTHNMLEHDPMEALPQLQPLELDKTLSVFKNDSLVQGLPSLVATLSKWLIVVRLPIEYWRDKLLRVEAAKIFGHDKADWGETRRRWIGNYLSGSIECPQYLEFKALFQSFSSCFDQVMFTSYILKTNVYNLECIRALVMTTTELYKVNIDTMSFTRCFRIDEIRSVSVTPAADQLVVLHTKSRNANDLVFSFYSPSNDNSLGISTATHDAVDHNTKVGEFVAILRLLYES